jgi:hypothetical protein
MEKDGPSFRDERSAMMGLGPEFTPQSVRGLARGDPSSPLHHKVRSVSWRCCASSTPSAISHIAGIDSTTSAWRLFAWVLVLVMEAAYEQQRRTPSGYSPRVLRVCRVVLSAAVREEHVLASRSRCTTSRATRATAPPTRAW